MTGSRCDAELQVLIVGAGIGGLALANFLQEAGLDPVVVERAPTLDEPPGVVELWPTARALVAESGAAESLGDRGATVTTWRLCASAGTEPTRRTARDQGIRVVQYPRLRTALCDALAPGTVTTATTLHTIEQTATTVRVTFANGVTEQFDVVVGADGAGSRTRALLGEAAAKEYGTMTWLCPRVQRPPAEGIVERWRPDDIVVRVLPTDAEPVALVTQPTPTAGDGAAADAARSGAEPPPAVASVADRLGATTPRAGTDDVRVTAVTWTAGRVALLGDAAHAHHHLTGLGATLAVEDAAVLRAALVGPSRAATVPARLAEYAAARRRRLARGRAASVTSGPLADVETPFVAQYPAVPRRRGRQLEAWFEPATAGNA